MGTCTILLGTCNIFENLLGFQLDSGLHLWKYGQKEWGMVESGRGLNVGGRWDGGGGGE